MVARFHRVTASALLPAGGVAGLIGLVLLVLESTRALSGNVLGSAGETLLWVGVALVVVGGLFLLLAVVRSPNSYDSDGGQPANG